MGNSPTRVLRAFVEHVKYKVNLKLLHPNSKDMREYLTKAVLLSFSPIFKIYCIKSVVLLNLMHVHCLDGRLAHTSYSDEKEA